MIHLQLQIFLLLLIGYYLGKKGYLTSSTRSQLTNIIISVILPCSIISSFQISLTYDILQETVQVLLAAFFIQLLYLLLNLILYRFLPADQQISCKYSTMVTNASFIGLPIISALYGQMGLLYASIFVIPQRIFMWVYGLPLYTAIEKKAIVHKIITHPCVLSILLGLFVTLLQSNGVFLPKAITNTLSSLGGCTTALCMLVIGSILSDLKLREMFSLYALYFSFCRLLLIPVLILLLLKALPLSLLSKQTCILLSAMPAPTTVVILAQQYSRNPAFASKLMVTSTLCSLISIPIILWLSGVLL